MVRPTLNWAIESSDDRQLLTTLFRNAKTQRVIDLPDRTGETPLTLACRLGHVETVRLLIQEGADINQVNRNKQKPRDVAKGEVAELLDAEVKARADRGEREQFEESAFLPIPEMDSILGFTGVPEVYDGIYPVADSISLEEAEDLYRRRIDDERRFWEDDDNK
ncbi:MAG: ankyrin repeat domain-containing protein [Aestuariivirgaceae bacterium]